MSSRGSADCCAGLWPWRTCAIAGNADASWHERYLDVLRCVGEMREEMAHAFDDLRRSNALVKLSLMRERGLLTDEEFAGFSDETRQSIERLIAV